MCPARREQCGEDLPRRFACLRVSDFVGADCLLVLGSSLQVSPFNSLVTIPYRKFSLPRVLVNREKVCTAEQTGVYSHFHFDHPANFRDLFLQGNCDDVLRELADELGWTAAVERSMELSFHGLQVRTDLPRTY